MTDARAGYALHVGERGASRLALLQQVYGPSSESAVRAAGLRPGMRVVDLGCGAGAMTRWFAEQVGAAGSVVAVDESPSQLHEARREVERAGLANVTFAQASAHAPGLPAGQFDLVYARFLLMHVPRPGEVLAAMRALLAPGGAVVCEEAAVDSSFCLPERASQRRLQELATAMAARRGCDFNVAHRLYHLVREAGFEAVDLSFAQPVHVRGEAKRLEELSFAEAAGAVVASGLATGAEVEQVLADVHAATQDEAVVYALSRMVQVRGRR